MATEGRMSIYRASRGIKKRDNSLYNALRSIYEDSIFVAEIAGLWPDLLLLANLRCGLWYSARFDGTCYFKSTDGHTNNWSFSTSRLNLHVAHLAGQRGGCTCYLPLLANLRCGLWYSARFDGTCYFKSTDGHTNNWSFSTSRLNLHVAHLAGQRGGCIVVDSTRKGKRFPDSMSKTIPIWACVMNRAVERYIQTKRGARGKDGELASNISPNEAVDSRLNSVNWDGSLHLPLWVPNTEKAAIEERLEEWTEQLEACGADIGSLASVLAKPLRPLWISQKTLIWLNEVPDCSYWDFTPMILVSASSTNGVIQQRTTSEFSWHYISGAGDDEESWARGLTPNLFWKNVFDLVDSGPDLCNQQVAEIVEKERVYHAQRGEYSPQVKIKPQKLLLNRESTFSMESDMSCQFMDSDLAISPKDMRETFEQHSVFWVGSTNLAVSGTIQVANLPGNVDSVLHCDRKSKTNLSFSSGGSYLHLPMVSSKVDKFSILKNLPSAIDFAQSNLSGGNKLLICSSSGEDISICVCLAILASLFDEGGSFDGGKSFMRTSLTKWEMRKRLVYICKFALNARPSRGNLKQVFGFLNKERISG